MTVTMKDVAARAGVSQGSVFAALRNPERTSFEMRKRVEDAARELGFIAKEKRPYQSRDKSDYGDDLWCWKCGEVLPKAAFPPKAVRDTGVNEMCTQCARLRRFGITKADFDRLPGANGPCALCGEAPSTHIDHDHSCCPGRYTCGKCIRAVLCGPCNLVVGRIEALRDRGLLEAALSYIGI